MTTYLHAVGVAAVIWVVGVMCYERAHDEVDRWLGRIITGVSLAFMMMFAGHQTIICMRAEQIAKESVIKAHNMSVVTGEPVARVTRVETDWFTIEETEDSGDGGHRRVPG